MRQLATKLHTKEDWCVSADDVRAAARAVFLRQQKARQVAPVIQLTEDSLKSVMKQQAKEINQRNQRMLHLAPAKPNPVEPYILTTRLIIDLIARQLGLVPNELLRYTREASLVTYRDAAIVLAARFTRKSPVKLGPLFGGRDASTVRDSLKRLHWLLAACDRQLPKKAPVEEYVKVAMKLVDEHLVQRLVVPKAPATITNLIKELAST